MVFPDKNCLVLKSVLYQKLDMRSDEAEPLIETISVE